MQLPMPSFKLETLVASLCGDSWSALATLLSPTLALAADASLPANAGDSLRVRFPLDTSLEPTRARLLGRDADRGMALLELATPVPFELPAHVMPASLPRRGERCQALVLRPDGVPARLPGTVLHARGHELLLRLPPPALVPDSHGAPVLIGEQLVGMLLGALPRHHKGAPRAVAVPLLSLRDSPLWATLQAHATPQTPEPLPAPRATPRQELLQAQEPLPAQQAPVPQEALPARQQEAAPDPQPPGEEPPTAPGPTLAGFRPDDLRGEDRLGIDAEVDALVSVVAARDVEPPLSLGLFADWGSGKSFFMRRMEERIRGLAEQRTPGYCSDIVQIRFNAWHYIDTANLWASLTAEIFEQLAQKLAEDSPHQGSMQRARLLAAASSSRDVLSEALQKKEVAEGQLRQGEQRRQRLEASDANLKARMREPALEQLALQQLMERGELREKAQAVARRLRLPMEEPGADDMRRLLRLKDTSGRLRAFWSSWRSRPAWERWRLLLLGTLIVAASAAAPLLSEALQWWTGVLGTMGAGILVVAGRVLYYLREAGQAVGELDAAWRSVQAELNARKEEQRQALERERLALARQVAEARQAVDAASSVVRGLEEQLDALRADRQLSDFIRRRHESTDYTQHLGVIARAHQDFEQLTRLLEQTRAQHEHRPHAPRDAHPALLPRIERIVLYIDDLDRCPEDKVVEVLQAVHLLLAFELFVVVVGVDSRWLLHALGQRFHWQATPLGYLEKIFQIPYALRPMERQGFASLIDDLAQPVAPQPDATLLPLHGDDPGDDPEEALRTGEFSADLLMESLPPSVSATLSRAASRLRPDASAREPAPVRVPPLHGPSARARPLPEPLRIEPWERDFMKELHGLIPSPRATKRLVNTYRLLHASLAPEERESFVGTHEAPGEHRQALLLLAMLTGYPEETAEVLEALVRREPRETWWAFLEGFSARADGPEAERWRDLLERLGELRARGVLPEQQPCLGLLRWAQRVARYSFHARPVLLARKGTSHASEAQVPAA